MQEHLNDEFVKRAQKEGYRARAAYKLIEIDDKDKLIKPGMTIVDLGSSPGSWSQVAVQRLKGNGKIIALDILDMTGIAGVTFIQGDFREEVVLKQLQEAINNKEGAADAQTLRAQFPRRRAAAPASSTLASML